MGLFSRKKAAPALPEFPPEDYEPVLRCSICTGEQVAGFRDLASGHFQEVMLLRSPRDLERFKAEWGITEEIAKEY